MPTNWFLSQSAIVHFSEVYCNKDWLAKTRNPIVCHYTRSKNNIADLKKSHRPKITASVFGGRFVMMVPEQWEAAHWPETHSDTGERRESTPPPPPHPTPMRRSRIMSGGGNVL
jgi:hypothetical protein